MNGRETSSRDLTVYVRYESNGLQRYLQLHSWNLNGYMAKKKKPLLDQRVWNGEIILSYLLDLNCHKVFL